MGLCKKRGEFMIRFPITVSLVGFGRVWVSALMVAIWFAPLCAEAEEVTYTVFVTSQSQKGDFGGLAQADAICQAEAELPSSIVPEGRYLAWLSDTETDPQTLFTRYANPIVLPDWTWIADNFDDLTDGSLAHAISMDPSGATLSAQTFWSGTSADGTRSGSAGMCAEWKNTKIRGLFGNTSATDSTWSSFQVRGCHFAQRFACFQQ